MARITVAELHDGEVDGSPVVSGELVNHSAVAQNSVPVFIVGVRGGRVVTAGRAVVGLLEAHVGASSPFQVFLVGRPAGARLEVSAPATSG